MSGPVVFEGSILARGPVTGVGGSFLTTLRAYTEIASQEMVLLLPPGVPSPELPGVRVLPAPRGSLGKQFRLPWALRRLRPRVLHSPVAALPLGATCPMVATVHDMPWMSANRYGEGRAFRARWAVRVASRRAAAILVPSQATRRDLLAYAGTKLATRVQLVPHGVEKPEEPAPAEELQGPFLILGDDRPRKNHDRLRRAHQHATTLEPDLPDLLFVGPPNAYVEEREKWRLLRQSRALLYPSLFEGFGLPVLEAMAHGVPVLCTNRSSLPEVAGDAALSVDPEDENALAQAMIRIHRDDRLREELRAKGLQRASEFTPLRAARAWLHIHEEVGR
jgi:glycosyltransferase involved in cell wall biosynthesis